MARPNIPGELKNHVEELHERAKGYPPKSFQEGVETISSLAEESLSDKSRNRLGLFLIEAFESQGTTTLVVRPKGDSEIEFEYFQKGDPPNTAILDTGISWIGQDPIEESLEEMDPIESANIAVTKGEISIDLENDGLPVEVIERMLTKKLEMLIKKFDEKVVNGEVTRRETRENAIAPYWPHIRS